MTGEQFSAALHALSLTRQETADWLGVSLRSVERWCSPTGKGPPRWVGFMIGDGK